MYWHLVYSKNRIMHKRTNRGSIPHLTYFPLNHSSHLMVNGTVPRSSPPFCELLPLTLPRSPSFSRSPAVAHYRLCTGSRRSPTIESTENGSSGGIHRASRATGGSLCLFAAIRDEFATRSNSKAEEIWWRWGVRVEAVHHERRQTWGGRNYQPCIGEHQKNEPSCLGRASVFASVLPAEQSETRVLTKAAIATHRLRDVFVCDYLRFFFGRMSVHIWK